METLRTNLKICQWNANGIIGKKEEMTVFLEEHKIDVMLLQETHLKPCKRFEIRNYDCYRNDRKVKEGGGTAILIKRQVKHDELPPCKSTHLETTGIKIKTLEGDLNIYSVYLPPNKEMKKEEIKRLLEDNTPTIISGDLNAKHEDWNSKVNNLSGMRLKNIGEEEEINIIGPDEDTHIHKQNNTADVLDIILHKNIKWKLEVEVLNELSSDHLPITTNITLNRAEKDDVIKIINWNKFKERLKIEEKQIRTKEDIEDVTIQIQTEIKKALEEATESKTKQQLNKLPPHIKEAIREKNKVKRLYKRTLYPQHKTELNRRTNEVKGMLDEHRNENWNKKLETIQTEDNSLWKITKALTRRNERRIPPIQGANTIHTTDKDKAEAFANTLTEQYQPNNMINERIETEVKNSLNMLNYEDNNNTEVVTTNEIKKILKSLNTRKAPGWDGVTNAALKNLNEDAIQCITHLTNAIYKHKYFPEAWKLAVTVMIRKPGKPANNTTSYRPISLLPTISKVVERTINSRVIKELETKKAIPKHQFGFRREHSTVHQIARITEDIIEGFNTANQTAAVFLDIEKAFDKVWHDGVLHKMRRMQLPPWMTKLIRSYLTNRRFAVKINDELSRERQVNAGVPQGSILGPTLFNIYVADMPKTQRSKIAQYADDTMIYTQNRRATALTKDLQTDLEMIYNWLKKWKIKINEQKTVAIRFCKKKKREKPPQIKLNNTSIEWQKEVKYLGITLDENLTFKNHIKETKKKTKQLKGQLYPLIGRNSKMSIENKLKIVKAVVIPTITYGGEIWSLAKETDRNKLQTEINTVLRWIVDAPWYISNEQLRNELKIETLDNIIHKRRENLIAVMEVHKNSLIQDVTTRAKKRKINTHTGIIHKHEQEVEAKRRRIA